MQVWVTRHGQTDLNHRQLMQGLTDEPLNATGIQQARDARHALGNPHFDAVYASPLQRALQTAQIMGATDKVITDPRLVEMNFGKFELVKYGRVGTRMAFYWLFPDRFPAPATVETYAAMAKRTSSFVTDLRATAPDGKILIACHGAIMRFVCGALLDKPNYMAGRGLPKSCAVRVFQETGNGFVEIDPVNANLIHG